MTMSDLDALHDKEEGTTRRTVLKCMTWAGTGVLWTVAGGVPRSLGLIGAEVKLCKERYGKHAKGAGWYSFDQDGVHFIGLVNVVNLKAGGLGSLGEEQLKWLEDDLKGKAASTPIVVFAHIPLWVVY